MEQTNIYIQKKDEIRKDFLISLAINWALKTFNMVWAVSIDRPNTSIGELTLCGLVVFALVGFYQSIMYYCAYKKNGTKMLMFGILFSIGQFNKEFFTPNYLNNLKSLDYIISITPFIMLFFYLMRSYCRMYMLNRSLKIEKNKVKHD